LVRVSGLGLLITLGLVGCADSLPLPPYAPQTTDALSAIRFPPPPGRVEHIPNRPSGANAWVDGEWLLRKARWVWRVGRWVRAPAGARYSPWVIARAPDGTAYYAPGAWKDTGGAPLAEPSALAFATAGSGAVTDADGLIDDTGPTLSEVRLRHAAEEKH